MPEKTEEEIKLQQEMFTDAWIESGFKCGKAYQKLHPDVTYESARRLGSLMLSKIDIGQVLEARGLGYDTYYLKLQEGLDATKTVSGISDSDADSKSIEFVDVPDFKVRREYHKALGKALKIETDRIDMTTNGKDLPTPILTGVVKEENDLQP